MQRVETVTNVANAPGAGPGPGFDENAAIAFGNLPRNPLGAPTLGAQPLQPPNNTAKWAKTTDLHNQAKGTGVGNTRPANWDKFTALIGGANPFKQGHALSQKLGGQGNQNNLSPFTGSLNGLHRTRAEAHVINHTKAAGNDEFADYDVVMNYGGNAPLVAWANGAAGFGGLNNFQKYVGLQAAGIPFALPPITVAQQAAATLWITNYVNNTFPDSIDCTAIFTTGPPLAPAGATTQQKINITNHTP